MFAFAADISIIPTGMVPARIGDFEAIARPRSAITLASLTTLNADADKSFQVDWAALYSQDKAVEIKVETPVEIILEPLPSTPRRAPGAPAKAIDGERNPTLGNDYLPRLELPSSPATFRIVTPAALPASSPKKQQIRPATVQPQITSFDEILAFSDNKLNLALVNPAVRKSIFKEEFDISADNLGVATKKHGALCKASTWFKKTFRSSAPKPAFVYRRTDVFTKLNKKQLATLSSSELRQYREDKMEAEIAAYNRKRDQKRSNETFWNNNGLY